MRHLLLLSLFSLSLYAVAPPPVAHVQPERFSGLWYEIARTYNAFEKDCVAATVEYVLQDDRAFDVYNRCFDTVIGGDLIEYEGDAEPLEGDSMSRIEMTYFWVFSREYRVIYLEADYSSAVVVDAEMDQVWIMNRTPFMHKQRLRSILSRLERYMDLERLIYTPQDKEGRYR